MILRPYQSEDVAAILAAHKSHRCVLGRGATGLGKACELAFVAKHYAGLGRVMVLVDVGKLVRQLAATIEAVTVFPPGIEMGDESASGGEFFSGTDRIVVGTVQSQYSGDVGKERFRKFNPNDFSALLLDECELFLAPKAREVVAWYMQNPNLKVYGCTATPMRTDGVAMANLFEHVAFDRDIVWGRDEGWLVPIRQDFIRCSIDFSKIKAKKNEDGDSDYSDAEVSKTIMESGKEAMVELAVGIIKSAEGRKSIVVCPSVDVAKLITAILDAQRTGCAKYVYGEMTDDEKDAAMNLHRSGAFQFLVSVMMLTKGYDDASILAVFNCRKTKSKRLYQQIMGRGTRPHPSIVAALNAAATVEERRAIIAASPKPFAIMGNLVGVNEDVRDITIIDILGEIEDPAVLERAKELMLDGVEMEDAVEQAEEDVAVDRDVEQMRAEAAAREVDEWDESLALWRHVQAEGKLEVESTFDLRVGNGDFGPSIIPDGQMRIFRMAKIDEKELNKLSPEQKGKLAQAIMAWKHSKAKCTFRQGRTLQSCGYSKSEAAEMDFQEASAAISEARLNGWKRPRAGVSA